MRCLCTKDIELEDGGVTLTSGKIYNLNFESTSRYIFTDNRNNTLCWCDEWFRTFFIDLKELRKLKIKKLNEKR